MFSLLLALMLARDTVIHARPGDTVVVAAPVAPVLPTLPALVPRVPAVVDSTAPELPRADVDVTPPTQTGRTIALRTGGDLQAALDTARYGDTIVLDSQSSFIGNYTLPAKAGTGWVVVRSGGRFLPAPGIRVGPADSGAMPNILSPNANPAIIAAPGAHHYRLVGLEIALASGAPYSYGLLNLGTTVASQRTLADVPHHLVADRVYVHGDTARDVRRCVAMNGADEAVVDSYLAECHESGADSQGIGGWNGPGPFLVENDHIEGAAENVMFGGAGASIKGMIPSDITIRRNHLIKPLAWKGRWSIKNLLELKNARRVLIEGNVLENSWVAGQSGTAFNLKSASYSPDSNDTVTEHVTVRANVIRNTAGGLSVAANPDGPALAANHIRFENNVFDGVGAANGTKNGRMLLLLAGVRALSFVNNTFLHNIPDGVGIVLDGTNHTGDVTFTGNVITGNGRSYGVQGSGQGPAFSAFPYYWASWTFANNALVGWDAAYEKAPNNLYPPAGSPAPAGYGADTAAVARATAGVVAGVVVP